MKVVEFLKKFEELKYDNDIELLVLLISDDSFPKFVQIENICNNDDCIGYNQIGIVLRESENKEKIVLSNDLFPNGYGLYAQRPLKLIFEGDDIDD